VTHDPDRDDAFLTTACHAMRSSTGAAALDALGWWDLLPHLDDDDARTAVFAAFRAQGRELSGSAALGGIVAQPFVEGTAIAPDTVVAPIPRRTARRGPVWVLVGDLDGRHLLFDQPGRGVAVVDVDAVELRPVDVSGRSVVHEVEVDVTAHPLAIGEDAAAQARERSLFLGRLAAASETLGAAERAVDLAVEHAGHREQFGKPIGTFQAVRHLLAWAKTDCTALDSVIRKALLFADSPPERYGEVVKALAGRNGRRACERSLQVLGGIGFTAEHAHHHHHSRVLLLDSLLGSSAELSHHLGAWLRTAGRDPDFPRAVLLEAS
jgi:acyl-CoA dehydrogenase-like protein